MDFVHKDTYSILSKNLFKRQAIYPLPFRGRGVQGRIDPQSPRLKQENKGIRLGEDMC